MGGSAPDHTTTTAELPSWAAPYAQSLLQRGAALSDQSMPVYGGQRSADMNGYQTDAQNMIAQRALNGSSEIQAGSQNLQDTLNGNYLNGNPYLDANVNRAANALTQQYMGAVKNSDANFARSGAFGGSAWQQANEGAQRQLSQGLTDLNSSMYGQNYANERQNQMAAQGMALNYGNQAYTDANQLNQIGSQQYGFDQQRLTDAMNYWNDITQSPYKQLDVLGNTLNAATRGQSSVTSVGPGVNPYAQAVGGAAALYGLLK